MKGSSPRSWPTVPLGTLLTDIQPGFAAGKHNSTGEGVPHFRPMNVSTEGRTDRTVLKFVDPTVGRPELRLRRGDVVFNNTNSPELVGKSALFDDDDEPAFSNHMTRLRSDPEHIDPGYLALRLHQAWRQGWFAAHCNNHVSQASVGRDVLRAFEIEVPPLEVQRGILSLGQAVEGYRLSTARHLEAARSAIERFRGSVLAAASSGRLSEDWRHNHADRVAEQPVTVLGDKPQGGKILGTQGVLRRDAYLLPAFPESWGCVGGRDAFSFVTSGSRGWARYYSDDGAAFIRVGNLDRSTWELDLEQVQHVSVPDSAEAMRTCVEPGDVLISITAEVGMVGVAPPTLGRAYVNQHVAIARPSSLLLPEFVAIFLASPIGGQSQFQEFQRGATKDGLGLNDIWSLTIPVPPATEQKAIVHRASRLFLGAAEVSTRIDTAAQRINRVTQSILSKAFRGELPPGTLG